MCRALRARRPRPPDDEYREIRTVVLAYLACGTLCRVDYLRRKDAFIRHAGASLEYLHWAKVYAYPASFAEVLQDHDLGRLNSRGHRFYLTAGAAYENS